MGVENRFLKGGFAAALRGGGRQLKTGTEDSTFLCAGWSRFKLTTVGGEGVVLRAPFLGFAEAFCFDLCSYWFEDPPIDEEP